MRNLTAALIALILIGTGAGAEAPIELDRWSAVPMLDSFGDVQDYAIQSPVVDPIRPMRHPYDGTRAILGIYQCGAQLVTVRFTKSPNLTQGERRGSSMIHEFPVRVDGEDFGDLEVGVNRSVSRNDYFFMDLEKVMRLLGSAEESFSLAVPFWYEQSVVAFTWPMEGYAEMLAGSCE